ncbi:hypothetical protein [Streptococcus oricebi]|uniref:Integral membrane protein n=1 Tax=Streptococcus oricebi TaxID=1547447 RepID=A0ABS5B4U7_9STRE|nr:hypothetical protein [Streptococcus oricebi]MBP2623872.1 hypothetical protein [Streptococcus oricebi]
MLKNRKLLLSMLGAILLYAIIQLASLPQLSQAAAGIKLPESAWLGYDKDYILAFLTQLGAAGRSYYLYIQLPLDTLFPLTLAYMSLEVFRTYLPGKTYLSLLPILAFSADYLENGGLLHCLLSFPNLSQTVVGLASVASVIKHLTLTLLLLLVLFVLGKTFFRFLFLRSDT